MTHSTRTIIITLVGSNKINIEGSSMNCNNCGDKATKIYFENIIDKTPGELACDDCFDWLTSMGQKVTRTLTKNWIGDTLKQ